MTFHIQNEKNEVGFVIFLEYAEAFWDNHTVDKLARSQ